MFFRFDASGTGSLTKDDIMAKFAAKPEQGATLVKQLFAMDKDKNGEIDMDEFMFFWKAVKYQKKTKIEQSYEVLKQVLDEVEAKEKTQRHDRASRQIFTAVKSGRFSVMPKKFTKVVGATEDESKAAAQKAAREEKEAEEIELKIQDAAIQRLLDAESDLEKQTMDNDLALAEMKAAFHRLGEEEMPVARETVKTERQVDFEEGEDEPKVAQLEDYKLELLEKHIVLKAMNDLEEQDKLTSHTETTDDS